jgi:hypothetical protein
MGFSIVGFPGNGLVFTVLKISILSPPIDLAIIPPTLFNHIACSSFLQSKLRTK